MATPTEVRVEAIDRGTTVIRWKTQVITSSVQIHRSSTGPSSGFAFVASVSPPEQVFFDQNLADKTRYWYKVTEDGGASFSAVVDVTTYVVTTDHGAVSQPAFNAFGGSMEDQLEAFSNKLELSKTPCDVCVINKAIVLDCSTGCNWFRAIMDQDINSISMIGCEECPPVDFVVPPGDTFGICGWPVGCNYTWDECFQSPVSGGPGGRTAKTNGISVGGYGTPDGGPKPATQCCDCPPLDRIGAGDPLRIVCCEADGDCTMTCGEDFKVKACGGLGPYTWSKTGNVSLSSTVGACITAKSTQAPGTPGGSGINAWAKVIPEFSCTTFQGDCVAPKEAYCPGWFVWIDVYDCDQVTLRFHRVTINGFFHGSCVPGGGPFDDAELHMCQTFTCPGHPSSPFTNGCCGDMQCRCCDSNPTVQCQIIYEPDSSRWAGANSVDESRSSDSCPATNEQANPLFTSFFDLRTQANIDAGCTGAGGCVQGSTTLTVTDAAGVTATMVIA